MSLKLISCNIEGDNHYDRIFSFFEKEQPDIVCLQEVFEVDLPLLLEHGFSSYRFLHLATVTQPNENRQALKGAQGIAIFSKLPIQQVGHFFYESQPVDPTLGGAEPESSRRGVLWVDCEKEGQQYRVATTHFTWSPRGEVTKRQQADLHNLLEGTKQLGEHLICGDFNAPRGRAIFDELATIYTDNIPKDATTTIDQHLHRVSGIQLVVDALFTTPAYQAKNTRIVDGISDHYAIVAEIERKAETIASERVEGHRH